MTKISRFSSDRNQAIELFISDHLYSEENLKFWLHGQKNSSFLESLIKAISVLVIISSIFGAIFLAIILDKIIGEVFAAIISIMSFLLVFILASYFIVGIEKSCVVGLTNKRLIIILIKAPYERGIPDFNAKHEVFSYKFESLTSINISFDTEWGYLRIDDSTRPFKAKFRLIKIPNRQQLVGIANFFSEINKLPK